MRVVHDDQVLASNVRVADSRLGRARGLMFRRSLPDEFALVFPFDRAATRTIHMLFVPFPIDVLWVRAGRVEQVKRLSAWIGFGRAPADTIIELPSGAAAAVDAGDRLEIEDDQAAAEPRAAQHGSANRSI